jgi:hypothetical protein
MVRKSLLEERGLLHSDFGFYADVDLWMDLLHDHDAYYCADTLITGPTKEIQPRLFEDNIISQFLLMYDMQLKHRKKAFHDKPLRLSYEMIILWAQSFFNVSYCLLLVVKNHSFRSFISTAKQFNNRPAFLLPWTMILISYPLLFPLLRLFTFVKQGLRQLPQLLKKIRREPAPWLHWFSK